MKYVMAVSAAASRLTDDGATTMFAHSVVVSTVETGENWGDVALGVCHRVFPLGDGWSNHSADFYPIAPVDVFGVSRSDALISLAGGAAGYTDID